MRKFIIAAVSAIALSLVAVPALAQRGGGGGHSGGGGGGHSSGGWSGGGGGWHGGGGGWHGGSGWHGGHSHVTVGFGFGYPYYWAIRTMGIMGTTRMRTDTRTPPRTPTAITMMGLRRPTSSGTAERA